MKFVVDFQSADESGALTTSLEDLVEGNSVSIRMGVQTLLDDYEGHTAWATVVDVVGDLVDVRIDWISWRDRRFFASIPDRFDGIGDLRTARNNSSDRSTTGVEAEVLAARL